jgi:hypothetical protein
MEENVAAKVNNEIFRVGKKRRRRKRRRKRMT